MKSLNFVRGINIMTVRTAYSNKSFKNLQTGLPSLHYIALEQPGFISGKSFWNENYTELITLSRWDSLESWNEWKESEIRREVLEKCDMINETTVFHKRLIKYSDVLV